MKACGAVLAVVCVLLAASTASADRIVGVGTDSSYYGYNSLVMWEVGTSSVTHMGAVALAGPLGVTNPNVRDVTYLSDGRVAVLHDNATAQRMVSVLTPTIVGGALTGVTVNATFLAYDATHGVPTKITGTTKTGIVTGGPNSLYLYQYSGGGWGAPMYVAAPNGVDDVAGLTEPSRQDVVTTWYGGHDEFAPVTGTFQKVKTYVDSTYGTCVEGIRSALLNDGWVSTGSHPGSYWHTLVMDQDDPSSGGTGLCAGRITNGADPSPPTRPPNGAGAQENRLITGLWADLQEGRMVRMDGGAFGASVTFYVYTPQMNVPEAGEFGATAYGWFLLQPGESSNGRFYGQIAGDYIVEPVTVVPEPWALGLMLLGLPLLASARRRS